MDPTKISRAANRVLVGMSAFEETKDMTRAEQIATLRTASDTLDNIEGATAFDVARDRLKTMTPRR